MSLLDPHPDPEVEKRLVLMQRYMRWLESDDGKLPSLLEGMAIQHNLPFDEYVVLMNNLAKAISDFIIKTRNADAS